MGVPPSASLAVAAHVNVVDVVTPVAGEMVWVSTVGVVFSTVMLADPEAVPP